MGALRRSKRERLLLQLEMAEGGSAVEALVELTLDAERHGVYLQGGLVEPLLKHLVHALNVNLSRGCCQYSRVVSKSSQSSRAGSLRGEKKVDV